jgi:replicative DNA helicase
MMTTNSFQKKAIRERMKQTGEPYLEASRQLYGTSDKFPTPWSELNKALDGGLRKGSVTLLGARAGEGGTTAALNIALKSGHKRALYVSYELTSVEVRRMTAAHDENHDNLLFIHAGRGDFDTLMDALRGIVHSTNKLENESIDLIIIDYFELMSYDLSPIRNNGLLSAGVKKLALELNLPVLLLSKLSRNAIEDVATENVARFIYSSEVVQDADVVLTSHAQGDSVNLFLHKNRFGDYGQKIVLDWDRKNFSMTSKKSANNFSETN